MNNRETRLEFGGNMEGGDTPSHVMPDPQSVWHAGMRLRWVRWVRNTADGVKRGPWMKVVPEPQDIL